MGILLNCGQLQTGWTRLVWCSHWCTPSYSPREVNHKVNKFVPDQPCTLPGFPTGQGKASGSFTPPRNIYAAGLKPMRQPISVTDLLPGVKVSENLTHQQARECSHLSAFRESYKASMHVIANEISAQGCSTKNCRALFSIQ